MCPIPAMTFCLCTDLRGRLSSTSESQALSIDKGYHGRPSKALVSFRKPVPFAAKRVKRPKSPHDKAEAWVDLHQYCLWSCRSMGGANVRILHRQLNNKECDGASHDPDDPQTWCEGCRASCQCKPSQQHLENRQMICVTCVRPRWSSEWDKACLCQFPKPKIATHEGKTVIHCEFCVQRKSIPGILDVLCTCAHPTLPKATEQWKPPNRKTIQEYPLTPCLACHGVVFQKSVLENTYFRDASRTGRATFHQWVEDHTAELDPSIDSFLLPVEEVFDEGPRAESDSDADDEENCSWKADPDAEGEPDQLNENFYDNLSRAHPENKKQEGSGFLEAISRQRDSRRSGKADLIQAFLKRLLHRAQLPLYTPDARHQWFNRYRQRLEIVLRGAAELFEAHFRYVDHPDCFPEVANRVLELISSKQDQWDTIYRWKRELYAQLSNLLRLWIREFFQYGKSTRQPKENERIPADAITSTVLFFNAILTAMRCGFHYAKEADHDEDEVRHLEWMMRVENQLKSWSSPSYQHDIVASAFGIGEVVRMWEYAMPLVRDRVVVEEEEQNEAIFEDDPDAIFLQLNGPNIMKAVTVPLRQAAACPGDIENRRKRRTLL
jgi:hypothetical protein